MAATVEELLADGRHAEAARAARAAGDAARAARIFAQIWDFRAAADCALEAGDRVGAVAHLIDARAVDEAVAVAGAAAGADPDAGRAAADVLATRRVDGPAAALYERLGDAERAAQLYQRGGQLIAAARVLEGLGRLREAGRLLERVTGDDAVKESERSLFFGGDDERAQAHLALGRILARLGHHEESVRHLQHAARNPGAREQALPLIGPELAALGWSHAAAEAFAAARVAPTTLQLPAPSPTEVALIGGRYRPSRVLGAGAAGRVFLARDEVTGAEVAVKLFSATGHGTASFQRFLREAEVWRRASHPNILRILDFREDLGFLVMELATGGTLAERVRRPLPPSRVRRLALDVLAALTHAHDRGVVHRDIKPANIFFDGHGVAKLGDFGVAHLIDLGQTQTGALIGTLAYMSPEQITGAPIGPTADLYALGVTLFQALAGRLPFLGPDFIAQHLGDAPPRLPDAPPGWDELLAALLAKDPAARPPSAEDAAEVVRTLEGDRAFLSLPRAAPVPQPEAAAPEERPDEPLARYRDEVPLGATATATLTRAVDRALERTVVLERFAEGHPDAAAERRLLGLAAAATPYIQRVLGYDRASRTAVYEAPVGIPIGPPLPPAVVARVTEELARALAALAEVGCVHGAIEAARVLFDEESGVTLLAAGLPPSDPASTPAGDAQAAADLVRTIGSS